MSRIGVLSTARLTGLMASVGSDCHFEWVGMRSSVRPHRAGQPDTLLLARERVNAAAAHPGVSTPGDTSSNQPAVVDSQQRMADRSLHLTERPQPPIPLERVAELSSRLERELAKVIVGQQRVV